MLTLALLTLLGCFLLALIGVLKLLHLLDSIDRGRKHWRAGADLPPYAEIEIVCVPGDTATSPGRRLAPRQ